MKHEWKKTEKRFYIPKQSPEYIEIPPFKFFTLKGAGNPNEAFFKEYIGVLYSLSYAVKMSPKKNIAPAGYFDYTVYPLEGIWDLNEEARRSYKGSSNKKDLVFTLMIRQPDFVREEFAQVILEQTKKSKPHDLLDEVKFETLAEGKCIQMLHLGSYDNEKESFKMMLDFAKREGYVRIDETHREIYLSDARKVAADQLKTVLRFNVAKL